MNAPVAKHVEHTWQRPSGPVSDPWAWLISKDDPDTKTYLNAENGYTEAWYASHSNLVEQIFGEIKSRTQESDTSPPVQVDDWWYAARTMEGSSYLIHTRGASPETAHDDVILDLNVEADGHDFFDMGAYCVSPDHHLLAWSSDTDGDERYTLRIRDLRTGTELADELTDTTWAGVAWSADCTHLFYVAPDEQQRPYRVMRHRLGTAQADDVEVFRDDDERFFVSVSATRSDEWIMIGSGSKQSSEAWLLPAGNPTAALTCARPREDGLEYAIDHWGDRFVIVTNEDATDFKVMTAPLNAPAAWTEFIAHEPGRRITGAEPFADFLAIHEWDRGQEVVRIVERDGSSRRLVVDDEPHSVGISTNAMWETSTLRLAFQSMTIPPRIIDVDVHTDEITVVKERPTPNTTLTDYVATRLWTTADDGARVPVDIVHHVDTPLDGTAPGCVYGYGSYESSMAPWFSPARLSLLDRGVVWALVHPRGGGELGRGWYLDGKLLNKRNTFTDTLAVCDDLIAQKIIAPDRLSIRGASAGGLLVGACVTMRPDLFAAAVAEVPFVDVVNTMSDPTLPLTVTEWEEWGDPRSAPYDSYIASYSPYDNTVAADYPAMLITAGFNDPRVSYHEPAKWAARLRDVNTGDRPVLLKTEMGAGHGGPSGRYDAWRDEAQVLTFLLASLDAEQV